MYLIFSFKILKNSLCKKVIIFYNFSNLITSCKKDFCHRSGWRTNLNFMIPLFKKIHNIFSSNVFPVHDRIAPCRYCGHLSGWRGTDRARCLQRFTITLPPFCPLHLTFGENICDYHPTFPPFIPTPQYFHNISKMSRQCIELNGYKKIFPLHIAFSTIDKLRTSQSLP